MIPERNRHFRWLMAAIALLAALILFAGLSTSDASGSEAPVPTPTETQKPEAPSPEPETSASGVQAAALDIGPVYQWRWYSSALSNMCLENHSSFAAQTHTGEWNKANDLVLKYENCGSYPSWARIDLYNGYNSAKPGCWYSEAEFDSNNRVVLMRIFLNTTKPDCWSGTVRTNHWTSQAIGGALGLKGFNTYPPYYVSVMRSGSHDTVSYPQTGDRTTFDYYNNCGCQT